MRHMPPYQISADVPRNAFAYSRRFHTNSDELKFNIVNIKHQRKQQVLEKKTFNQQPILKQNRTPLGVNMADICNVGIEASGISLKII